MEGPRVRGALWLHLEAAGAGTVPMQACGPNDLLPAAPLRAALEALPEARQRALANDYARLWARTFRNLVRHLRGRPEQALQVFATEVYPFLRGERRAGRIEEQGRGRARLLLQEDLPPAYLAGLVEGFVGLAGGRAACRSLGHEVFEVTYSIAPPDRLARLLHQLSAMRLPFVVAALLAALLGVVASGAAASLRAAAVLAAVVGVQAASNALHDLRSRRGGGPFRIPMLPTWLLWATATAGYLSGAAVCIWLMATGTPGVAAWALAGLGLSLLFALTKEQGLGPFLAGFTYGPLVATGALHALTGAGGGLHLHLGVALASLPLGCLAAALIYVGDLADRPLDQAAGRRTLIVRLPRPGHAIGYALLVGAAVLSLLLVAAYRDPRLAWGAAPVALAAALLSRIVARHLDDPGGLAPARLGTLALHVAVGLFMLLTVHPEAIP